MAGVVERRVDWIELFFDLAFVAFVTQVAHGLHGAPAPVDFLVFLAWSLPAWWAWANIMVVVNLRPTLPPRAMGFALLGAMAAVALMAASVTDDTSRAWAFALGNAVLRLILLALWVYRARGSGAPLGPTLVYNGLTAVIWAVSAFLPAPANFLLWGVAILVEVLLLRVGKRGLSASLHVDTDHASERLGLFMIILMGESVLSLVVSLSAHWNLVSGGTALLGFLVVVLLAWGFFVAGTGIIETGLARLDESNDFRGLLDTVMFIPYLIVVGVTTFAAGLATAVEHPGEPLPFGAAICLGGGLALFYLANSIVILRYGTPLRQVIPWMVPGVLLPALVVLLSPVVSAIVAMFLVALVVGVVVTLAAIERRHRVPDIRQQR